MKPFLKWAGNKYKIVDKIKALLPPGERLVEPFVGSGALFLNSDYPCYLLTDANADLITLYQHLQTEGEAFINYCRPLFSPENNDKARYYALRDEFNRTTNSRRKSAIFLYMNKHGYNGLCRYNMQGGFNVPFGRYKRPYFPEAEMRHFALQAQHATFQQANFATTMANCQPGDVIYCDPPTCRCLKRPTSPATAPAALAGPNSRNWPGKRPSWPSAASPSSFPTTIPKKCAKFTRQQRLRRLRCAASSAATATSVRTRQSCWHYSAEGNLTGLR